MVPGNTFKKAERLNLKKRIEMLFKHGAYINLSPVKILWLPSTEPMEYPVQALFTVSSKRFKNAVVRNRIKRKLKEIYRLQKPLLYEELTRNDRKLLISIIYTGNDPDPPFNDLDALLGKGLKMLVGTFRSV
jgi:ribonuclease P protein component